MNQDIDSVLEGWEFKPGAVQARQVKARGRQVLQMRVELGVLQMEAAGRPDGERPEGHLTYFDLLQARAQSAAQKSQPFVLNEEQAEAADREFVQFYHRRICWLALRDYAKAVRDADHTLAFMDLVKKHSPSEDYTQAHEQYRGFVLFHRTQAASALEVEKDNPEKAIDEIRAGLDRLKDFFHEYEMEEQMDEDSMVKHLRKIETALREQYDIAATLQEQLEKAVAAEDYEQAARLRDKLKRRD